MKPFYSDPEFPPPNEKLEAAIGRFIITWGVLEGELDSAINILFSVDATLGLCISANLGTKAKVDMIKSAIGMHEEVLEPDVVAAARAALGEVSTLSGQFRNTLAHGQPHLIVDETDGFERTNGLWFWSRTTARDFLSVVDEPMSADKWNAATHDVIALVKRCHQATQEIWHQIDALDPSVRDNLYSLPYKEPRQG